MRMRVPALMLAAMAVAALAPPALAQLTSVTYSLYHYEAGTWIEYAANAPLPPGGDQPGTNLWRYTYELCNPGFSTGIRELHAFFNSDNVACATLSGSTQPANWTPIQVGPVAPANNWRLRFRTLVAASRIAQGACNDQYSIDFTWTCPSLPGVQNYDAVAGTGSNSGQTVPNLPLPVEPVTWGKVKEFYR